MKKKLGKTGISLPALGLGTGDFFWNSDLSDVQKISLIQKAIELGVCLIDTAEGYGDGKAEELVGEAIQGVRQQVVIASKFSPEHHRFDDVLKSCEKSLKRLKIDSIDLYQVHWPNPSISIEETMKALSKLVDDKMVKAVGVSNYSLREISEIQNYLGDVPLSSVQMEYNLFERTIEENGIFDYCQKNEVSLLAYSPLDQGQLNCIHPEKYSLLDKIVQKYGKAVPQIILGWLMSRKQVVPVMRTTSLKHLEQNAAVLHFELSAEDVALMDQAFPIDYSLVDTAKIQVALQGEWNHKVYQTLEQALENKLGFVPSPGDLAKAISQGDCLKPVRLKKRQDVSNGSEYDLVAGRIRYWAWVIAHGQDRKPIPAYIREDYKAKTL